jgi:hypothetical protein
LEFDHLAFRQQPDAAGAGEPLAEQEIAVAMQEVRRYAMIG